MCARKCMHESSKLLTETLLFGVQAEDICKREHADVAYDRILKYLEECLSQSTLLATLLLSLSIYMIMHMFIDLINVCYALIMLSCVVSETVEAKEHKNHSDSFPSLQDKTYLKNNKYKVEY